MARLLLAIFLVTVAFKVMADFSTAARNKIYAQFAQDPQESQKEDLEKGKQEVKFAFHHIQLIPGCFLLKEGLKPALPHGEPSPGFVNPAFAPPEVEQM
jgi:hypothetical protein